MKKRCTKCGQISNATPRQKRCKLVIKGWGRSRFYCWGLLGKAPEKAQDAMTPKMRQTPQEIAQRKLDATRKKISAKYDDLGRIAGQQARAFKALRLLEASARRLAQRASMTDAEIQAEREEREARAKARVKKTRAISLEA